MSGFIKLAIAATAVGVADAANVQVMENMHLMSSSDVRPALGESDLSFLLSRLVGTDSPLESRPPAGLPAPCLLHETKGTVALVVTGASEIDIPGDNFVYPLRSESVDGNEAVSNFLGTQQEGGIVPDVCASLDPNIKDACSPDFFGSVFSWNEETKSFDGVVDHMSATDFFSQIGLNFTDEGVVTHPATETTFDLKDETTLKFFAELAAFNTLPAQIESLPSFTVLSMVGPDLMKAQSADTKLNSAVDMIVAAAVPIIFETWSAKYDDDVFEVAVFRTNNVVKRSHPRRSLAEATYAYTFEEAQDFQIFTWTWFILLFVVFFSACSLGGVDIGNDDAGLYSTFKAGSYDRATHEHEN